MIVSQTKYLVWNCLYLVACFPNFFLIFLLAGNLVDEFVVQMLNTIDVVYEQSRVGRQLLVYVGSFIPRNLRILVMPLCLEQVNTNTKCCLLTNLDLSNINVLFR